MANYRQKQTPLFKGENKRWVRLTEKECKKRSFVLFNVRYQTTSKQWYGRQSREGEAKDREKKQDNGVDQSLSLA